MNKFFRKMKPLRWRAIDWPVLIVTAWIVIGGGIIVGSAFSKLLVAEAPWRSATPQPQVAFSAPRGR